MQHDLDDETLHLAATEFINLVVSSSHKAGLCPACVLITMQQIIDKIPDVAFESMHVGKLVRFDIAKIAANDDFETVGGPQ